ncbi:MAG: ABC transporter substrate-binding protein [Steroidobacteraceae bacterium]
MRRLPAAFAAAFIACVLMPAATASPAAMEPGGRIVLGMQLEPPVLDPTINPAAAIAELLQDNVYETLVRFTPRGEVQPLLARRWQVSADGLNYRFELQGGVRFHDGTVFDAAVAKFALDRARAAGSRNPQRARLEAIRSVEVVDPLTLELRLSHRDGQLLQNLGMTAFVMVSPASAEGNAITPVGTGPFRFSAWRRGDGVELVRNDAYWGTRPSLRAARFAFIPDPAAAYAALMSGDVQVFANFPSPESLAQFQRDPRFVVRESGSEGETLLALNNRRPPLDDLRVRRAIAHAIDRRAVIDGAMFGHGQPIGSHFPPQRAGAVDLTGRYPYSVSRARQLLTEAGYPHGFTLTLKLPPPSYARRSGEIIAAQLAQVGIKARLENIEWAQWLDQVFARHEFDATVIQHAEALDYDIYARDDYYFGYANAGFKPLLAALGDAADEPARLAALAAIQRRISEDSVNAFLFQFPKLSVIDRRIEGLVLDDPLNATPLGSVHLNAPIPAADAAQAGASPDVGGKGWLAWLLGAALLAAAGRLLGLRQTLRRMAVLAGTLLAASVVIFLVLQVAPGDPVRFMLGLTAEPALVDAMRADLGLTGPPLHRYLTWIAGCLHGDFGISYTYRVPVGGLIAERLTVSLPLAAYALLLTALIAVPLGVLAARHRGRWGEPVISLLTQVGVAVPNFWLGILLILVFAVSLRWVPAGGFPGWQAGWRAALGALTLPAVALALPQAAILARVLRAALLEVLQEDFVRAARAKGLSASAALWRHALPNALLPVLTVLGLQLGFLLAGAVVVENVFYLPGLGRLVYQAITQRDLIVVQAVLLLLVAAVVMVSFLVDVAYAWVDPRLRQRGEA